MVTVTLGNFDGIHRGHRAVIEKALSWGGEVYLLCFEPVARQYFAKENWKRRLTTACERMEILRELGLASVPPVPFDLETVGKSPDSFLQEVYDRFGFGRIVVGYDFHFGRNRAGNAEYLAGWCTSRGIDTIIVPPLELEEGPVKSERIRILLERGELQLAERLLGRPYSLTGVVARGKGFGRELGFPTLNLRVPGCKLLPGSGSYFGYVDLWHEGDGLPAAVFVPDNATGPVEAYIPDHRIGSEYGRSMKVWIRKRLRGVQRTRDIEELRKLIAGDVERVRRYAVETGTNGGPAR